MGLVVRLQETFFVFLDVLCNLLCQMQENHYLTIGISYKNTSYQDFFLKILQRNFFCEKKMLKGSVCHVLLQESVYFLVEMIQHLSLSHDRTELFKAQIFPGN